MLTRRWTRLLCVQLVYLNMIIKNISGESRYFGFGTKARGRTLANNATATLSDNEPSVLAEVQHYVEQGYLELVSGPASAQVVGGGTTPAAGYILVTDAVADNDTVTIAGQVFKFANAPTGPVLGTYYASLTARWAGDGAAAATAAGTLVTAINNVTTLNVKAAPAYQHVSGDYVIPLKAKNNSASNTGLTLAASGAGLAVSAETMTAGANQAARRTLIVRHTVTADEVEAALVVVETGFPAVTFFLAQVRDDTGKSKSWDGTIGSSGGAVILSDAGAVNLEEDDTIQLIACE